MSRTGGLLRTANPAGWGLRGWLWLLVVLSVLSVYVMIERGLFFRGAGTLPFGRDIRSVYELLSWMISGAGAPACR